MFTMQSFSSGRMSAGVSPTGGRYLEDGLVVPDKHLVSARYKQRITILKNKLDKKVERLMHKNLVVTEITIKRNLHFWRLKIRCYNLSLLNMYFKKVFAQDYNVTTE